ncbi:MAG: pimeloyl-ACP methyl ester esterase BioH [Chloroflexi bacterium]|nr:pimeloyl-ACP methyl ester esterase BioH [Chloroflexota bacterium]
MKHKIQYYQEGEGPPLTLIHGWGMNAAVFEPLSRLLSAEFRVTRVDLPGYGQSGWQGDADFEAQVDALADVLPDSTLLGWSLGGLYALRLAAKYPQRFNSLILLSCNPCFVQRDDWMTAVESSVFNEFSAALIDDWQATIRRFLGLQMRGSAQARSLIRQISELLIKGGAPDPVAMRFGLQLLLQHDARRELEALAQPVMAVLGQRDTLIPVELAQQLHRLSPMIRVECVAHSAHAPFLSHSEFVAGLISEFIEPTKTGQGGG